MLRWKRQNRGSKKKLTETISLAHQNERSFRRHFLRISFTGHNPREVYDAWSDPPWALSQLVYQLKNQ
jgi:hypothetical protein